ncbi:MAG: hypothetical protein RLZZ627_234 [Pseudomonadota bacterium]|jgi:uncharacterized protein YheU (UPF0270 family)
MVDSEPLHPVRVPPDALSPETLQQLIEEFVTREGTDYGETDIPLFSKAADVSQQLRSGDAVILYDPSEQSVNIVTRRIADQILPDTDTH